MEETYYDGYLTGLLNMASSLSDYIGPSYIKVNCYEKKNFKKEFSEIYKINKEELNLIETENSIETTLLDWFQDKKMVDSITYWFNVTIRGDKKVYLAEDKLVNILDSKRNDFYSLDNLFFVECKKYMFVFLLGNNE